MGYVCYIIATPDGKHTYCGITNNTTRRLRQHRQEICGGARYTARHGPDWRYMWWVSGFGDDKSRALSFEWHMKRRGPGRTPMDRRRRRLQTLLTLPRWSGLETTDFTAEELT